MSAQRFADPAMPFHREVHSGCAIGTSIEIRARAYQDQKKGLQLQLNTRTDIALNLVVPLNKPSQLSVNARVNDQYTSEIQKPVHIPLNTPFVLHIRIDTHVSEIYLNDSHLLDYVHRVNPLEIKEVSIEGPLIVSEVIFKPPRGASLEPLPSYDESVTKSVIPEFQNLSIAPTAQQNAPPYRGPEVIPPPPSIQPPPIPVGDGLSGPPPAGTVVPHGGNQQKNPPYPEKNYPGGAPPLPQKKDQPAYPIQPGSQPIAQVAPQPVAPPMSTMATQNRPATSYPPQPNQPTNYPPPQATPLAPSAPPSQQYPGSAPQQYPPPQGQIPGQYPSYPTSPPTNVYPGPNPAPYNPYAQPGTSYQQHPQGYPPQQAVYPMYQQGFPQSYVTPTYPMYQYPSVYYDDCHHHHHHC